MSVPEKHIGARASNIKGRPETPTVSNRKPCLYCRGLGTTVVRQEWYGDGRPKKTEYQICSWCHGRGWQPEDGFEFPPPGTVTVGDYTARLRHRVPFSIGFDATPSRGDDPRHDLNCDVFPVHQEFDRDMIEIKSAGGLMIPKALIEDARDGKGLLDVIRENMAKAQVEENEEMAARLLATAKTVDEIASDLYPTYGPFAQELAENIKSGMTLRKAYDQAGRKLAEAGRYHLADAIKAAAPLAHAAGARTIKELTAEFFPTYGPFARELAEGLVKARVQRFLKPRSQLPSSPWASRSPRDDEMTPDHALTRWERPDDDWEGISLAAKRRILSARRRRALKDKIRPKPANRRSRAIRFASLRESRGIPSWGKAEDQEQ